MQPQVEHVVKKLEHLTPDRLAEVEDFIDFLHQRDQDQRIKQDFRQASENAFNQLWDNDADAIYDSL